MSTSESSANFRGSSPDPSTSGLTSDDSILNEFSDDSEFNISRFGVFKLIPLDRAGFGLFKCVFDVSG